MGVWQSKGNSTERHWSIDMVSVNFWLKGLVALIFVGFLGAGCETSTLDDQGTLSLAELQGQTPEVEEEAVAATEESGGDESSESESSSSDTVQVTSADTGTGTGTGTVTTGGWPAEITGSIKWLHTNVSSWPVTASLNASVRGGTVNLPYSKSKVWHAVDGVNANPWVFVNLNGQWYAATWEYLRYGQTSKQMGGKSWGGHIKVSPLSSWEPHSGERVGLMVSGLARSSLRNVKERSNVTMVTWP